MSSNAIEKILWEVTMKPAFAERFRNDPEAYLKDFRLDDEERSLLLSWDVFKLVTKLDINPLVVMSAYAEINGMDKVGEYIMKINTMSVPASSKKSVETFFPGRFEGKVAVVTGAAQGIGYEVAKRLGLEGASVVVADAAADPANEAVQSLLDMGVKAVASVGDLSTAEGAAAAMKSAHDAFGALHVLVNNVGGTIWAKPFWHYQENEIRAEIDRSLWPTLWCCHAAVDYLRQSGGGAIVNIGSNAATGGVYRIPYAACKGAVISLTESLAVELASLNIRVNCVSPGGTAAPQRKTPRESRPFSEQEMQWWMQLGKMVQNEELLAERATVAEQAAVITFMASSEANHITGEVIETGRRGLRVSEVLGFVP